MNPKKGLATWAGLVAAVGQYLAAVAVFLEADNQSDALGPLVTATATLLAVIVGRMQQAKALTESTASARALGQQARQMGFTVTGDAGKLNRAISDAMGGSIGGRAFKPGTGVAYAYPPSPGRPGEFDDEPTPPPESEFRDLHENDDT